MTLHGPWATTGKLMITAGVGSGSEGGPQCKTPGVAGGELWRVAAAGATQVDLLPMEIRTFEVTLA